jgi:membrane AbrB-like protein
MVSMAEAYGADVRLVAFMQYVRVLIVVLTASSTSRVLLSLAGAHAPQALAVATRHPALLPFLGTVAIGAVGATIGWRFRIPAGGLLVPMVLGAIFQGSGAVSITLPGWLLAVAYTGIGLFIGLGFNREVLFKALKALPQMMLATLMLILLCGLTAWMLVVMLHVDPLTAYLATTPGGVDTVTIITVGSQADVPLVLAVQTARIFAIILTGPYIVKLIERHGTPVWRFQMPWA